MRRQHTYKQLSRWLPKTKTGILLNIRDILAPCLLIFGLLTLCSPFVSASNLRQPEKPPYFDLSLQELMNMSFNVSVSEATDREASILKTPAIVSRYNSADLHRIGLSTLKDFLSFVPGLVWNQGAFGNGQIMIRGISENFGQKVLFMLDDIPYSQPAHSALPLLGMPLAAINHIEVIRGPGLVQQGSGATTGVIKIVTKKYVAKNVSVKVGSNKLANTSFYINNELSPGHNISFSTERQAEDGFLATYENNDKSITRTHKRAENFTSLLANYYWKDNKNALNVTAHTYKSEENGVNNPEKILPNILSYFGDLFAFSYDQNWSDHITLGIYSDYNKHYLSFDIDDFPFEGSQGKFAFANKGKNNYRWRSGAKILWDLNDKVNWTLGYEYEHKETGNYEITNTSSNQILGIAIDAEQSNEKALYTQIDSSFQNWRLVTGVRYVEHSNSRNEYLPQLSLVYSLSEHQSIKALYSVGFNSPNFFQTNINIPNPPPPTVGNPDLYAEKVASYDLSYTYFKDGHQLVANIYFLEAKDFIERVNTGNRVTFQNSLEFNRSGYELDYQFGIDKLRYFMNVAYQHQGQHINDVDTQAKLAPKYTLSLGGHYTITNQHNLGASWRFVGERYSDNLTVIKKYNWLNLQYQYTPNNWEITFTVENALNDKITNPDVGSNTTQKLVRRDGIGYLAGISWHY